MTATTQRRTRVERHANLVLGRFYRLRMLNGYDDVERVASGLAAAIQSTEATLVRVVRREQMRR